MATTTTDRITRDDLEDSFKKILGEGEQATRQIIPPAVITTGVVAALVVFAFYLIGRRRGRRRSAVVEVRRI